VTGPVVTWAGTTPEPDGGPDLRATGERIEALLEAASSGGTVARERAEELVRLVVDLYGAGLERLLEIVYDTGRLDDELLDRLAGDDLVASLLTVHGLHPYGVETRVARALDSVRPYLGSHGGDVEFLGLTDEGVVRLRMLGSCDGCASSAVTLTLAVETAITAAAPEVSGIEVEEAVPRGGDASVIPVASLRSRLEEVGPSPRDGDSGGDGGGDGAAPRVDWTTVEELAALAPGQLGAFSVRGVPLVGTRIGTDLFAYRNRCPGCGADLAGGVVERRLGGAAGDAVLRCPACSRHYDVRHAGRGLDGTDDHLEPVPLLVHDGVASVAVPTAVRA
jgi:Fe-S cluster biogenesis protein NfuA/nitrite reductase/ring-hydroxylating ferredoxin subunit